MDALEWRYRLLAENTTVAVMVVSPTGALSWASPSLERVLGYSAEEAKHLNGADLVHPDDLAAVREELTRDRDRPEGAELDLRFRHRNGEYRWMAARAKPLVDDDGTVIGRVETIRDIHEAVLSRQRLLALQAELAAGKERLEFALSASRLGTWDWDLRTGEMIFSERCLEIVGRARDGTGPRQLAVVRTSCHPDDLERAETAVRRVREGLDPQYDHELRMSRPDGQWVWVRDRGTVVEWGPDGMPVRMAGTHEDVTERRRTEAERLADAEMLRVVLATTHLGVARYDRDMRVDYVNEHLVHVSGIPEAEWLGRTISELPTSVGNADLWAMHLSAVIQTGEPQSFEFEGFDERGTTWFEAALFPEFEPDGSVGHVITSTRDVTSRKRSEDSLLVRATRDPLTGLANRAEMYDEIARAQAAARRSGRFTAVLVIDIDRFKSVNDSLGHAVGDELLVAAAARMQEMVRSSDMLARPGGDEFVVVMRELEDPDEAARGAARLVEQFRRPFAHRGGELFATISAGVAVSSGSGDADDLLREADAALYAAKEQGRDRVLAFGDGMRAALSMRASIEVRLAQAIEQDELAVWYQPEIDLATGAVIAVEALLRWHHPDGDLYSADRFIQVAEETGLILPLGAWALRAACMQAVAWSVTSAGPPLTVRVNISTVQLADPGLLDAVEGALDASGLEARYLSAEITEASLLKGAMVVERNLRGLGSRGVRIAVDNFGTGYASLSYLREYAISVLKLDRTFVSRVTTSEEEGRLLVGIVRLADSLGMTVTAEGVEDIGQAAFLRSAGCSGAQGYLFSAAVPADQIGPMLSTGFTLPG
jgi:diguanylate cyclase (GGDEF)-like protein/PAS domain S-box-containing protein